MLSGLDRVILSSLDHVMLSGLDRVILSSLDHVILSAAKNPHPIPPGFFAALRMTRPERTPPGPINRRWARSIGPYGP